MIGMTTTTIIAKTTTVKRDLDNDNYVKDDQNNKVLKIFIFSNVFVLDAIICTLQDIEWSSECWMFSSSAEQLLR